MNTGDAFTCYNEQNDRFTMRGFTIRFANGYVVSVVFGTGNYCDQGATTAEIGVWDENQEGEPFVFVPGFTAKYDQVGARITPEQVAALMAVVSDARPGYFALARVGVEA